MAKHSITGFARDDGRVGSRNHLLVLPSVVCATRVAQDIARGVGGVSVVHQHGCSQIGDDEVQTAAAFERIACNPNVGAVLVVSLGCETVQGRELARAIGERGQRVELVVIQESGGSDGAVADGTAVAWALADELRDQERVPVEAERIVVGIETARQGEVAAKLARLASDSGASLVLGSAECIPDELGDRCRTVPAFTDTIGGDTAVLALEGAGSPAEQHTALVAAGAQLVVSFPDDGEGPVGFPLCPVVSVGGSSTLHAALAGEFDVIEPLHAGSVWRLVSKVISGAPCVAETLGLQTFALSRLARSM